MARSRPLHIVAKPGHPSTSVKGISEGGLWASFNNITKIFQHAEHGDWAEDVIQDQLVKWLEDELEFESIEDMDKWMYMKCKFKILDMIKTKNRRVRIDYYDEYFEREVQKAQGIY